MKKALVIILALLMCTLASVAYAGTFAEDNGLIYVTEAQKFTKMGALTQEGDALVTLTDEGAIRLEMQDYAFSGVYYCCTPDDGVTWNPYLNYENNFYSASAYIMKIKNGEGEVGMTPASIAFDSTGATFYAGITGNDEDYPIALVANDGTVYRAESYYSVDRYFFTVPANFDGYVVIPYDRFTADLSEGTEEAEGDLMDYHNNEGYRFFWALGIQVESFVEEITFFDFEGVYLAETPLELDIPEEGIEPSQTEDATPAPETTAPGATDGEGSTDATTAPGTTDGSAPSDSNNMWILISIGAAAVVVIVVVIIIIVVSKKKSA